MKILNPRPSRNYDATLGREKSHYAIEIKLRRRRPPIALDGVSSFNTHRRPLGELERKMKEN